MRCNVASWFIRVTIRLTTLQNITCPLDHKAPFESPSVIFGFNISGVSHCYWISFVGYDLLFRFKFKYFIVLYTEKCRIKLSTEKLETMHWEILNKLP